MDAAFGRAGHPGAAEVEVAVDGRGRAHVVWVAGRVVKASMLRLSGTWTRPVVLHETRSGPLGTRPRYLELSVNRGGAAVVAWQTMDDDEAPPYADSAVQVVTPVGVGRLERGTDTVGAGA